MYVWTGPWAHVHEPTPLLRKLTGEFADRIAALWPAPHGPVLIAPAARRHLICLALHRGPRTAAGLEPALSGSLKVAIASLLRGSPNGLARALERLGEEAWTTEGYDQLLAVLKDPLRAKVLNHAKALTPDVVAGTFALPTAVVRAGGGRLKLNDAQAQILREAYEAIARRVGGEAAEGVAERWGRAGSVKQLFEWAAEDIVAEIPPSPLPVPAGCRPLTSKADFREAAIRFRNCLRTHIVGASSGDAVFYEWLGPPGAIIHVQRDAVSGWRLCEVKATNNEDVPEQYRPAIIAALQAIGVGIGPSHWNLSHALEQAGQGNAWAVTPRERLNEPFE
jgi:hypothetical protein